MLPSLSTIAAEDLIPPAKCYRNFYNQVVIPPPNITEVPGEEEEGEYISEDEQSIDLLEGVSFTDHSQNHLDQSTDLESDYSSSDDEEGMTTVAKKDEE